MSKVIIQEEYITLGKFLKLKNFISSGAEARFFLLNNEVKVNGVSETRRGKKIKNKDVVAVHKIEYTILNDNKET